ncbi:MAG TPA: transglycosylase SLT domain-containing protein [Candidatus Limnocylindrales bacterium]|nr:hypothetical protein [Chloroflexota bacterium]
MIGLLAGFVLATRLLMFGPPSPTVEQARAWARETLGRGEYACLNALAEAESRWDPTAANPSGAYGIPQAKPADRMAIVADDYLTNPVTQVRWMVLYSRDRYGSVCGAAAFELGWYDREGRLHPGHGWY